MKQDPKTGPAAVALRKAATAWASDAKRNPRADDTHDIRGQRAWNRLRRAALAYAKHSTKQQ